VEIIKIIDNENKRKKVLPVLQKKKFKTGLSGMSSLVAFFGIDLQLIY
jgi:hypothetical protein